MGTTNTVSPLRQRMIEDMTARNLGSPFAAKPYPQLQAVCGVLQSLARHGHRRRRSPLPVVPGREWSQHRQSQSHHDRGEVPVPRYAEAARSRGRDLPPQGAAEAPLTMSPDEAERLLAMAGSLRDLVMLSLGYGCGLRAGEIVRLRAGDIDSAQMIIRDRAVEGAQGPACHAAARVTVVAATVVDGTSDAL